ncbi:hypothetical protein E2C01_096425 [Portunus trituberculatus]|uniref:Uncharacterized protein n=1 Tax=Portunus trituberculatus TaxID=210409 RepID=A0A5B7K6Z0_PORTR|nr:hypothetical protein [Portunus trituberculatus]
MSWLWWAGKAGRAGTASQAPATRQKQHASHVLPLPLSLSGQQHSEPRWGRSASSSLCPQSLTSQPRSCYVPA